MRARGAVEWILLAMASAACGPEPTGGGDADVLRATDAIDGEAIAEESDSSLPAYEPLQLESLATWGKSGGFGGEGHELDDFSYPSGIALSPDESELYVFDSNNNRIKAMTLDGMVLRTWHHPGYTCAGAQSGIAVAADGTIYIANDEIHGIDGYAPDGSVRYEWRLHAVDGFCHYVGHIHDLTIDGNGNVAVGEAGLGQVQVFSPSGEFLSSFGEHGTNKGQFKWGPDGLAFRQDEFYVSDANHILVFDAEGNFQRDFKSVQIEGIVFDQILQFVQVWHGWLFVGRIDGPPAIYAMAPTGTTLRYFWQTTEGNFPGQLNKPSDTAIDSAGRWFVTELYNHRIQVFQGPRAQ